MDGMRDASGQMYMRNRYYDPGTGQFTQPDPIGIAGGLNVYGFAAGDPVTYNDPFGLWIEFRTEQARELWNELHRRVNAGLRSDDRRVRAAARHLRDVMNDAANDREYRYELDVRDFDQPGAGSEKAMGSHHYISVNTRAPGTPAMSWIVLAHELGGAQGFRRGDPAHNGGWMRPGPAIRAEDAARVIAGCRRRRSHANRPPECVPGVSGGGGGSGF